MKISRVITMILSAALVLSLGFSVLLPSAQAQESSATIVFIDPEYCQIVFVDNWPGGGGYTYWMEDLVPFGLSIADAGFSMHAAMAPPTGNLRRFGSWNTHPDGIAGGGTVFTVNTPVLGNMFVYAQWLPPLPPPAPEPLPPLPPELEIPEIEILLDDDIPLAPEIPAEVEILPDDVPLAPAVLAAAEIPDEEEILPDYVPLAAEPPAVPEAPDEEDILPDADLTEIEDEQMPMAPIQVSGDFAMSNLILSICGILMPAGVLIAGKRWGKTTLGKTQKNVCLAVIYTTGLASVAVFALTQDMSAPAIAFDNWTVLHAATLTAQGICTTLLFKGKIGGVPKAT